VKSTLFKCISEQIIIKPEVLDDILSRFQPLHLDTGEFFTEPGKLCNKMAFIHSGVLRMFNYHEDREITLWIGSENRFITDLSSFNHQTPAKWHIEAVTLSKLLTISRDDHFSLLKTNPKWLEFDNRLLTSAFTILEERMFSHLYMSAEERYQKLMESDPSLFNRVPLKQIASMLGMTPETLSRLRSKKTS